jgi:opacity protein-like surface antigen
MKKLALAVLVTAAGLSAPCFAQSWYADLGVGRGKVSSNGFSDTQTAYAARVGYRFNPNIAVDAGYYDFGKHDDVKFSSWAASVVASAPIDAFDIYGRIGYARTEAKGDNKVHKSTALYGAGGRYMFTPQAGLYVEYLYQKPGDLKIDGWMLGAQFRF